MSWCKRCKN